MCQKKLWIFVFCLGLLVPLMSVAQSNDRDVDQRDLSGISTHRTKYVFSVLGGAAAGAGLGFVLPGSKTPAKLAMIGGGGVSTWFLHTHRDTLGGAHNFGMIVSNTVLGGGIGWLGCDCNDGLVGGFLIGGGATAIWQALKNDHGARSTISSSQQ